MIKKLQEEFSMLPKVLIKKTLCGDDVNGDLVKARQRLQEFKQIHTETAKQTKRRAPDPPKPKPKPNWTREPGKKQSKLPAGVVSPILASM